MRVNPDQGVGFAQMLVQDDEPLADINQVIFIQAKVKRFVFALFFTRSFLSDCWHFHGTKYGAAMHSIFVGCFEK
jgi:hypothetical protein